MSFGNNNSDSSDSSTEYGIDEMDGLTYEVAIKKAHLVERNIKPDGIDLVDPSRVSTHEELDIISLARQIQDADKNLQRNACAKLALILDQIKVLQSQAQAIVEETERNRMLHEVACNLTKMPGRTYHLYQRPSGQKYFSIISPEEWGDSAGKQTFLGSYRLESDCTFTPVDKIAEYDRKLNWTLKCLNTISTETKPMIPIGNCLMDGSSE